MLDRAAPLALVCAALALAACDRGSAGDTKAGESTTKAAPGGAEGEAGTKVVAKQGADASGAEGAGAGGTEAETQTETKGKDGKTRAAEAKAAAKAAGEGAKAKRTKLLTLLNEGRKAVKDKRYDEGIALYRQALTIDPASPKVLGELGFAALKIDELDLAESSTRRAIDLTPPGAKGLGALYYNLGLIADKRGEAAAARTAYERSLEARPGNEIVAAKLAKLGEGVKAVGPASAEALCKEVMLEWECYASEDEILTLAEDEQEFAGLCECEAKQMLSASPDGAFILEAVVLGLEGTPGYGGMLDEEYLALRTSGQGWQLVTKLSSGYTPGVMGISNSGGISSFEFVELSDAPGQELRVVVSNSELDSNMGINTLDYFDTAMTLVCYAEGDKAGACVQFKTLEASGSEKLFDDEPCDEPLDSSRWEIRLEIAGGKVEIAVVEGKDDLPAELADFVGEHSFAEAVAHPWSTSTPLH